MRRYIHVVGLLGILVLFATRVEWRRDIIWGRDGRTAKKNNHNHDGDVESMTNTTKLKFTAAKSIPRPSNPYDQVILIWEEYKKQHSHQALLQENADTSSTTILEKNHTRKFAMGYYSCPLQAGNRLHHYLNALIWSIVTNRTLLWHYYDRDTCSRVSGKMYDPSICRAANHQTDCSNILKRAEWIPSFDQWYDAYTFSTRNRLSFWSTHAPSKTHKYCYDGAEAQLGIVDQTNSSLVDFPQMLGQDASILKSERKRSILLTTTQARQRAEVLLSAGADFLYGLLLMESFSLQPSVAVPYIDPAKATIPKELYSTILSDEANSGSNILVAVHSRHSKAADDGSKIRRESKCLDNILTSLFHDRSREASHSLCQVMLLSDRPLTISRLREHILMEHPSCQILVAPHERGVSFRKEHGPYSGIGFFQDLAMVSNQTYHNMATSSSAATTKFAFIGSKTRSSSQLIREIMSYHIHKGRENTEMPSSKEDIHTCFLEEAFMYQTRLT